MSYRVITPWGQTIDTDLEIKRVVKVFDDRVPNNIYVLYDDEQEIIYVPAEKMCYSDALSNVDYIINFSPYGGFSASDVVLI